MKAWESNIRKVEPYVPGEQPKVQDVIKLNTNENPYGPSENVRKAMEAIDIDRCRLYPDPDVTKLVKSIADYYGMDNNQVFVGVGSDDVLSMCFLTFFNENGGVIFPNPNAPTGLLMDLDSVRDIIEHNKDVVVIVDEAYIDFGGVSAKDLVNEYDNVLVVQTFSKSRSMAGMRIGYAFGSKELIKALNDVKFSFNSYTMNMTSIDMGVASINDKKYFEECVERITATRERTKEELTKLGFTFPDSKANFIFATHKSVPAKEIFEKLKDLNIFVRYFAQPGIDNYLRITIGTDEQMDKLISALSEIVG